MTNMAARAVHQVQLGAQMPCFSLGVFSLHERCSKRKPILGLYFYVLRAQSYKRILST